MLDCFCSVRDVLGTAWIFLLSSSLSALFVSEFLDRLSQNAAGVSLSWLAFLLFVESNASLCWPECCSERARLRWRKKKKIWFEHTVVLGNRIVDLSSVWRWCHRWSLRWKAAHFGRNGRHDTLPTVILALSSFWGSWTLFPAPAASELQLRCRGRRGGLVGQGTEH